MVKVNEAQRAMRAFERLGTSLQDAIVAMRAMGLAVRGVNVALDRYLQEERRALAMNRERRIIAGAIVAFALFMLLWLA